MFTCARPQCIAHPNSVLLFQGTTEDPIDNKSPGRNEDDGHDKNPEHRHDGNPGDEEDSDEDESGDQV